MSQLQEEKCQLQEELVVLRERLALHDSDQQATSAQLQNQVPGEAGTAEVHCGASVEGAGGRRGSSEQPRHVLEGRVQEPEVWASLPTFLLPRRLWGQVSPSGSAVPGVELSRRTSD